MALTIFMKDVATAEKPCVFLRKSLFCSHVSLAEHVDVGIKPVAMATGSYHSLIQLHLQVVAVLMSDWSVLCLDHQLKLLWKTTPLHKLHGVTIVYTHLHTLVPTNIHSLIHLKGTCNVRSHNSKIKSLRLRSSKQQKIFSLFAYNRLMDYFHNTSIQWNLSKTDTTGT